MEAHPFSDALSQKGFDPIKLAYKQSDQMTGSTNSQLL